MTLWLNKPRIRARELLFDAILVGALLGESKCISALSNLAGYEDLENMAFELEFNKGSRKPKRR